MPTTPTYPGVYIEEVPSAVRPIVGVATSIAAFIGFFSRGPMDEAVRIFSWADFEREFGGLNADSEASYAIQQFFLNGGTDAWVVRTAEAGTAKVAAIELEDAADGSAASVLLASAANEGDWGNDVRIEIDYGTSNPTQTFNLSVIEVVPSGGKLRPARTETFRNLTMTAGQPNFVVDVVNDGSKLIRIQHLGQPDRPAHNGTLSDPFLGGDLSGVTMTSGDIIDVSLNNGAPLTTDSLGPVPTTPTLSWLASRLQAMVRAADPTKILGNATVRVVGSSSSTAFFQVKSGTDDPGDVLSLTDNTGNLAGDLGLDKLERTNVQQYALGKPAKAAQINPQQGDDGSPPVANALIGSESAKTGLYALEDADLFNVLCIPRTSNLSDTDAAQVIQTAEEYCRRRRAFYILDVPQEDKVRDEVDEIKDWLDANATLRHTNAALYFPRLRVADPLKDFRLRPVGNSGTVAGLYARTDAQRGVWKAPAGTEARLRGVQELEYRLTDGENGTLNPLAINCHRTFDVYGNVCWGARTLDGADQQASQWKYIPVRRLALFLEESLYRGTQWVVFEPNDEPLWSQIRLNVGAFMHRLFRQGAFQGQTPQAAYLVKCDKETTTQDDIDQGIVNILVGFAPLKPAEFVIIKISQIAGQIPT